MYTSRIKRSVAGVMAAGLIFAACGGSDSDTAGDQTDDTTVDGDSGPDAESGSDGDASAPTGAELALEGAVDIAAGTTLDLDECPDDWDPFQGVDGDEIRIGLSGPQSGPLAGFGAIGEGTQMYFDYVNDTNPIDGKKLVQISADDGYEAGRTVANVSEMIDSDDIFAFAHIIGTPNNFAARPITDEACVPQLFASSGFPNWGDPGNFPWTTGGILNYATETEIWCADVKERVGADAKVAALIMNNDFGKTYQNTLSNSDACSDLDVVSEQIHDPAAADVTNEMTTLVATGADAFFIGTTGKFCTQSTAVLAGSTWRPATYMSYTCNNLASFFEPVKDAIATLEADEAGPIMTGTNKICGDPAWDEDPAIQLTVEVLADYGDVTCADGAYSTGVLYGQFVEEVLRAAAAMPGGLNRVNLMAAYWNIDTTNDQLLGGTLQLDGVNDSYFSEAAQLQRVAVDDAGELAFVNVGELIDFEGEGGTFGG